LPKTRASGAAGTTVASYIKGLAAFLGNNYLATSSNQVNNTVYYSPVQVPHNCTVHGIIIVHGATARTGNIYVALYDKNPASWEPLNRVAVSASVACSGITQKQLVPFTVDTPIVAGLYFCAVIKSVTNDNLLDAVIGSASPIAPVGFAGTCYWTEAMGAYVTPPAVATPIQTITVTQTVWMWLYTV